MEVSDKLIEQIDYPEELFVLIDPDNNRMYSHSDAEALAYDNYFLALKECHWYNRTTSPGKIFPLSVSTSSFDDLYDLLKRFNIKDLLIISCSNNKKVEIYDS